MKQFFSGLLYKGLYGSVYLVGLLPMRLLYGISWLAYLLVYRVVGYRRAVVIQNVSRAFPAMRYGQVQAVVKQFYADFTAHFAEIAKSIAILPEKLGSKLTFVDREHIERPLGEGRNVIVALGHCGNWEMLNYMPRVLSRPMYAVYKPLRSETMNRLMISLRSRFGMRLISDSAVVRHLLTRREEPSAYLFLADQSPRIRDEKYHFEFLHQPAYHFSGMEKLARAGRSAVVYLHITQPSKGHYRVVCQPVCDDAGTTGEGEITRKYAELLTRNINDEPCGWLWSHRRWKK